MTTVYKFKAAFTSGGEGFAPDPAPVITVVDSADNVLVNAQATTALANLVGVYIYSYSGADDLDLVGRFVTTDTDADDAHLFSYTPDILTTNLTGKLSAIAASVWAYASRTLTQTAAQIASTLTGSTLTLTNRVTFEATLTGLTIPSTWTEIILTAKVAKEVADSQSTLQIKVTNPAAASTDGIIYLVKQSPTDAQRQMGSLTIDQAGGEIDILVSDDLDFADAPNTNGYDIKCIKSDGKSVLLTSGVFNVALTETREV